MDVKHNFLKFDESIFNLNNVWSILPFEEYFLIVCGYDLNKRNLQLKIIVVYWSIEAEKKQRNECELILEFSKIESFISFPSESFASNYNLKEIMLNTKYTACFYKEKIAPEKYKIMILSDSNHIQVITNRLPTYSIIEI